MSCTICIQFVTDVSIPVRSCASFLSYGRKRVHANVRNAFYFIGYVVKLQLFRISANPIIKAVRVKIIKSALFLREKHGYCFQAK